MKILIALALAAFAGTVPQKDQFGGWPNLSGQKTGFFHTQQLDGRWWLITPDGNAFFSKGVDNISYYPEAASAPKAPSDPDAWAATAVKQVRGWDFNTAGAWSSDEIGRHGIAYTVILNIAASTQKDLWLKGGVVDYFSPEFREAADRVAARECAPHAKDPWLLGYFTDNELRWGRDWRSKDGLLEVYLKMPPRTPGFLKATEFVKAINGNITKEDEARFDGLVAAEYARVTTQAIRRYDPNHLVLGCRFALYPGDAIVAAVGNYFDVISLHSYDQLPPVDQLRQITHLTGKPAMLTEFSFKAMDSGLPNSKGGGKPVATQANRADGFTRYANALADLPGVVGYHWFEYRDEPKEGRFDGEDCNYGVVTINQKPWELLTTRMTAINSEIEARHARSKVDIDTTPPK